MDYELISVIVCTYNQEDTIGRTLDSILSQECHLPIEIVIGEDCSTDRTLAVCQQYQEQHPDTIRILANKPNKGFVRNYFDCLRACRGKYIADCAGDDFWIDKQKLEKSSLILDSNPDVGIVHTDWLRHNEQTKEMASPGRPMFRQAYIDGKEMLIGILMPRERPAIQLCTSMYRNEWIQQAMRDFPQFFDPDTYQCEDVQIAFFLARMGRVAYLDTPTLAYTCGGTTISNPDNEEKLFLFWANTTRLSFDLAQAFDIHDDQLDRFFQARIHKLLMHAFRSGKPSLKTKALKMQQEINVADNRQILFAKVLLLPAIWQIMRFVRNVLKSNKTQK
ncbi:MAG: glycosyltransferase [Bacteroidaceae bacterium]|nr:glycosyltransferase [Bacteroidaceae bacterium]